MGNDGGVGNDGRFDDMDRIGEDTSRYSFVERLTHFMGVPITTANRQCVEIAVLVEVGKIIRGRPTMRKPDMESMALSEHLRLTGEIPLTSFANNHVKVQMRTRLYNAQSDLTGKQVWSKAQQWLAKIRNEYVPQFPVDLAALPSGNNLSDAVKTFVVRRWKEANPVRIYLFYSIVIMICAHLIFFFANILSCSTRAKW